MILIMLFSFALLFFVNSILLYIDSSFSLSYIDNISGQASLSPSSENSFTLFGSDTLLVGEYLVQPVFDNFEVVEEVVNESEIVKDSLPLISSAAQMDILGHKQKKALFGVNYSEYRSFFPGIELIYGHFPQPGEKGIIMQEEDYLKIQQDLGRENILGELALLTVAYENSFVIREVPVIGVIRYPIQDNLISRIALVDADTARSLNGYVYGAVGDDEISEDAKGLIDSSLDDLFGDTEVIFKDEISEIDLFSELDNLFSSSDEIESAVTLVENTWNFILLRFQEGKNANSALRILGKELEIKGSDKKVLIRNWRQTVGGSVLIVWFVRIILNIGIIFVIFGAVSVTINAITLSVLERKKEIGTMRSIGASKEKVSLLIGYEVFLVLFGSALIGIIVGWLCILFLNKSGYELSNLYLQLLFGGGAIQGDVSILLFVAHIGGAVAIFIIALVYPLKKVLTLTPVKAMQ